ncbi:hypothetical protein [Mycobacterium neumannii]|uniref:hypothetical protein n=1 Tax=Mycobacterium neumannii TaxID=2048551 RepID=UPI003AB10EAA
MEPTDTGRDTGSEGKGAATRLARRSMLSAVAAAAVLLSAVGLAGVAQSAPSGPGTAIDTIRNLESKGKRVIVNRVGTAPLSQCNVSSVAEGHDVTVRDPVGTTGSQERIRYSTVYVTVRC